MRYIENGDLRLLVFMLAVQRDIMLEQLKTKRMILCLGIRILIDLGMIQLAHKPMNLGGALLGGAIFAELYPYFKSTILSWKNFGAIGLPEALGVSAWIIIAILWVIILAFFLWFWKKKL